MMPVIIDTREPRHTGLNRTFMELKPGKENHRPLKSLIVLIVPLWN